MIERRDQLQGPARDVVARRLRQPKRGICRNPGGRPQLDHTGNLDETAADEILGAGA
jgi:hypothetical protein